MLPKFGVKIKNGSTLDEFERAIKSDTKAIYIESISNPTAFVADIEGLSKLAHKYEIPLIVDNTFATPYLLNPIKYGADVVVYLATKALNGHGSTFGGIVVDSGNFNWNNGKFPQFNEPSIMLKDLDGRSRSFLEVFGNSAFSGKISVDYLIVNVTNTTHGELSEKELEEAEITQNTVRLSLDLEDSDDLIEDLKQAFE